MIYAPILITTLNRYECLRKCIESLQQNSWADRTELFISVDYPPAEKYVSGYKKIKTYLENTIEGFKEVHVFFQDKNLGVIDNAEWLRDLVCESNDRYIFLEDDNELAPGFIEFCDKGLELFEEDDSIFALNACDYVWCGNGYTPPVRAVEKGRNNVEKRQLVFHAVAYWEHKRKEVKNFYSRIEQNKGFLNLSDMLKLHKKSRCFFYQFLAMVSFQRARLPWYENKLQNIDFMMDIYMMLFDKYVVCPIGPLQRDLGVEGNGVNYQSAFVNAHELEQRNLIEDFGFDFFIERPILINDSEIKLHDENINLGIASKKKIVLKYIFKRWLFK